jgi:hypothetical protein
MSLETRLFIFKLAGEGIHDGVLSQLRPHKVDLLDFFFVVEEPPETGLEKGSDQD